jgi:hypothetical protein
MSVPYTAAHNPNLVLETVRVNAFAAIAAGGLQSNETELGEIPPHAVRHVLNISTGTYILWCIFGL